MPVLLLLPGLHGGHHVLAAGLDVPQAVHLGVVARPDEAPLPDGEGRLVHDGPVDELPQVGQVVQLPGQGLQQGGGKGASSSRSRGSFPSPAARATRSRPPAVP